MTGCKRKPATRSLGPDDRLPALDQQGCRVRGSAKALDGNGCERDGDVTMRIRDVSKRRCGMRFAGCDMPVRALASMGGSRCMDLDPGLRWVVAMTIRRVNVGEGCRDTARYECNDHQHGRQSPDHRSHADQRSVRCQPASQEWAGRGASHLAPGLDISPGAKAGSSGRPLYGTSTGPTRRSPQPLQHSRRRPAQTPGSTHHCSCSGSCPAAGQMPPRPLM